MHSFCFIRSALRRILTIIILFNLVPTQQAQSQNFEVRSIGYNTVLGGLSAGIGAVINKKEGQKWIRAFGKGFLLGMGGGMIEYAGKKANYLIGREQNTEYAWLSRIIFSAGNSIVENASANITIWSRWHFDIGFIRLEFNTGPFSVTPRFMPSAFGGVVFLAVNGKLNVSESIHSGTLTFTTPSIRYAPTLTASTPTNGIIHKSSLTGSTYYWTYGHEIIHTFQFQEFSGINYYFKQQRDRKKLQSNSFNEWSKWIYLDLNYEAMLANYFLIQGGYQQNYHYNFLEIEAEILSTGHR